MTDESDLVERERQKYSRLWQHPEYHERSPGLDLAPVAWAWFQELRAETLTDWGCGPGRALTWFRERNVRACGIDLVASGEIPGTIWSPPPELPVTDFCYSVDVLEHLPEDHVTASLGAIARHTALGGFLQIATIPDYCGRLIGEVLHLTVQPARWWLDRIGSAFHVVRFDASGSWVRAWIRS